MKYKHIYGPVPSRRLGASLGIDPVLLKVCSFDCVYCEVAKTTLLTTERKEYVKANEILNELKIFLKEFEGQIDYVTFSGSGEPTLNSKIGYMIEEIKKFSNIPVAVLTNASLIFREDVKKDLLKADLIKCTLDAATDKYFKRVNQPESTLSIKKIIDGIVQFSKEYKGQLLIEIMLVRGVNDTEENYRELNKTLKLIKSALVQITTVVRPPSFGFAKPLSKEELIFAQEKIGNNSRIIGEFSRKTNKAYRKNLEDAITNSIRIRPQTIDDLSSGLEVHRDEILKYIELLEKEDRIIEILQNGKKFYKACIS